MLNIGDKVVPINKTVGCSLAESAVWKAAQKKEQGFLYVIGFKDDGRIILDETRNTPVGCGGDFFQPFDVIPYVVEHPKLEEMGIVSIQTLNSMVKQGILKETDTFHVRRA